MQIEVSSGMQQPALTARSDPETRPAAGSKVPALSSLHVLLACSHDIGLAQGSVTASLPEPIAFIKLAGKLTCIHN